MLGVMGRHNELEGRTRMGAVSEGSREQGEGAGGGGKRRRNIQCKGRRKNRNIGRGGNEKGYSSRIIKGTTRAGYSIFVV